MVCENSIDKWKLYRYNKIVAWDATKKQEFQCTIIFLIKKSHDMRQLKGRKWESYE